MRPGDSQGDMYSPAISCVCSRYAEFVVCAGRVGTNWNLVLFPLPLLSIPFSHFSFSLLFLILNAASVSHSRSHLRFILRSPVM